jgi:hypothetical protein
VYRITQEALASAEDHGGVRASVRVRFATRDVLLEVRDSGNGAGERSVVAIRERVAFCGGKLHDEIDDLGARIDAQRAGRELLSRLASLPELERSAIELNARFAALGILLFLRHPRHPHTRLLNKDTLSCQPRYFRYDAGEQSRDRSFAQVAAGRCRSA